MATGTYVLEVNWNGDGATWVDETQYLIVCEWRRGRDYASQITGRSLAGTFVAQLRNPDGRFSSLNTSSPLTGNILPGRKVRFRSTSPSAFTLWTGFLDEIRPIPQPGNQVVQLRAYGPLGWIARRRVRTASYSNPLTAVAIGFVLDDAGWPGADRVIDAGQVTMNRWAAEEADALTELRKIEETEFGFITETKDGKIVFEDVHHRLKGNHVTSLATFSDAAGATHPYVKIEQLDPWLEILNRIEADVALFTLQSPSVLWQMTGETPQIAPGASATFLATYPTPGAATQADHASVWLTPVASTDYTANTAADGSGTDITASVAVSVEGSPQPARSFRVTLTNNHPTATAHITLLRVRGQAQYRNDPTRVVAEDSASQTAYGRRTFRLPGLFYPSTTKALSYAQYGLSRYKDPHPTLAMTINANGSSALLTQALTLDISLRITVVANNTGSTGTQLGINGDFFIESEQHRVDRAANHTVIYQLSDAKGDAGYWALGTSTLGLTTKLAP